MGGNIKIGATVDVAEIKAGMDQTTEAVKEAAQRIPLVFDEAAGRTRAALNRISDDVKRSAEVVSIESQRIAQATKAQAAALADVRNATVLAKDAKVDDASTTAVLAAAQQKYAAAMAEVAAAKKAEAEAIERAAEEEELSENSVVRTFQRAARAITESTERIREQMVETAETAGLEAEGINAGFAGFGKLLGAGIAVGFAANYIDGLAKVNVELDHLSVQSGMSIESLAGLQQIVREMGGEWDPIATGLIRFNRAQAQAEAGSQKYKTALAEVGLKIEDLKGKTPEEQLSIVAAAFQETTDRTRVADAAITLFGKGGIALVPVLKEQGAALAENVRRTGELTGITEQSAEQARRWTQDTARLSAQFRAVMIPVMEHAEDVLRGIWGTAEAAAAAIMTVFETVVTAAITPLAPIGKLAQALWDLVHGNFQKALDDSRASSTAMADIWKHTFSDIKSYWGEVANTFTETTHIPKPPEADGEGDDFKYPKRGRDLAFQHDEEQLNQLRLEAARAGYKLSVDEEVKFWEERLAAVHRGGDEYRQITAKLASLEEERLKRPKAAKSTDYADVLGNIDVSALNASFARDMEQQQTIVEEGLKGQIEAVREANDEKIRAAQEAFRETSEMLNAEMQMGKLTLQEQTAALRQALSVEYQEELAATRMKEILDLSSAQKYQQDLNRTSQITRQNNQKIAQLMRQTALETQKVWQQAYNRMTSQFNEAVARWVTTGKGFGQAMEQIASGMAETFTKSVMKMAEQYLLGLALQKTGQKSQIFADAKTAAANTYSAVSAIPVVGPYLAPPAAAVAFAGVMAFDSFSAGGVVKGNGSMAVPILAHAGERVLSASETQNFETLVNTRTESNASRSTLNMGGLTQNFHGSKTSPRDAARGMQDAIRRGRVRFA